MNRVEILWALALVTTLACSKQSKPVDDAPKTTEPVEVVEPQKVEPQKVEPTNRRDEVIDKMQAELNELDKKIADLETQAKAKTSASREAAIAKLKAARTEADAALKSMRAKSEEGWDKASAAAQEAVLRVKAAAQAAEHELTKE